MGLQWAYRAVSKKETEKHQVPTLEQPMNLGPGKEHTGADRTRMI